MDPLTLQTVADYARGTLRRGDASREVAGIATDTRDLRRGELFLALVGEKFDGHRFLAQAGEKGAVGAIVSDAAAGFVPAERFALIEVADTLLGYQRLAAAYRDTLPLRIVAITGSNGKTSTKDFAAAVLGQKFRVLKTEGNFNNHIGVPRMLLRADKRDQVAVLEMGMNHPGEIKPLADMAKPDVAIITNIGTAHIEYMGSREAIAQEKGVLIESVDAGGHVILPAEDPFAAVLAARTKARVITAGLHAGDLRAENVRRSVDGNQFDVLYAGERARAFVGVPGDHMIVNALLALAAGIALDLSLEAAVHGLASASLTKGRLQRRQVGRLQFIDDSYNANPDSMVAALTTLANLPTAGRRIAVLGKMGELGVHAEEGHCRVGAAAATSGFDCVVGVGNEAALIARCAAAGGVPETHTFDNTDEAARYLAETASHDDLILIKGSRSAGMERVISALASLEPHAQNADEIPTH